MFIRLAEAADAANMLLIYSPFILRTGITQETEIPTVKEFTKRVASTLLERPWLVCETEGEIAGYAYAGKHRERRGYQWCTEPSVYVSPKYSRKGVAYALYTSLFEILKKQGYVNAYAVITLPNPGSVAFHEDFGFRYLTTYKKIGYKLDRWHDVGWWEIQINKHEKMPIEPVKLPALDRIIVTGAVEKGTLLLSR